MDLSQGYNQIPMKDEDKCKTAFYSRRGLRQFSVMPFGACGAPFCFVNLLSNVLRGLQWEISVVYLDDILCYSGDISESIEGLTPIFQRFRNANLTLKPSKCHFFQKSVKFLGHIVSQEGIKCDPSKIEAVKNWPRPSSVSDVRSFLGFAAYYRRFFQGFGSISSPLYELTKKNVKFNWSSKCENSFQELKQKLITSPVLAYPVKENFYFGY